MRIGILFFKTLGVTRLAPRRSRGRGKRVFGVFGMEWRFVASGERRRKNRRDAEAQRGSGKKRIEIVV